MLLQWVSLLATLIHTLLTQLLHCDTDTIFRLPDESDNADYLKQLLLNWNPPVDNITQRSIPDVFDRVQLAKLLAISYL